MIHYNEDLTKYLLDQSLTYKDFIYIFHSFEFKKALITKTTHFPISSNAKLKIDEFMARATGTIVILPFSQKSVYDAAIWIDLSADQIKKFIYLKNFL